MRTIPDLETLLAAPSDDLVRDFATIDGDLIVLGVGGKMGPSLVKLAKNAADAAGVRKRVLAVSRFSSGGLRADLEDAGIETIAADLMDDAQLQALPDAPNVIYMVGMKFGTTGREHLTWAANAYLPGRVAAKYASSRIVVFSSGNVYPLVPVRSGAPSEEDPVGPVGEYAQSVLARERVFEHFSRTAGTPVVQFRLNYAIDLRYGVLLEVARSVREGRPVDLRMGNVNVIWQGDANELALRSLAACSSPPTLLNVTGPETVSIRWLATRFGERFGTPPAFENEEEDTALLNDASKAHALFGYPKVSLRRMIDWTADWLEADGETLDKPTHFQERKGAF